MRLEQAKFIELLLNSGALKLNNPDDPEGLFTLKSGRRSPFFMNMGALNNGSALSIIGDAYAHMVYNHFGTDVDILFGPAYKGIPLSVATLLSYRQIFFPEANASYCCNRKELKDHGDKGILLGEKPKDGDRVVIIEDVTTSGKSIEETMPILKAQANVEVLGLIVAFDRMEYGHDRTKTALEEIAEKYGIETHAVVNIQDVLEYLREYDELTKEMADKFRDYYAAYGPEGRIIC